MTLAIAIKHVPARYSQAGHDEFAVNLRRYAIGTIMKKAVFVIVVENLRVYVPLVEARCLIIIIIIKTYLQTITLQPTLLLKGLFT